jgi:hypothetical protein
VDVLTWLRAQWDRVLGFVLVAAGAIALVVAYEKAASTRYLAEQITVLISGGLGGIFCLGAGATLLVCADIRDEWRKLDRIEGVLLEIRDELALPRPSETNPSDPTPPALAEGTSERNPSESTPSERTLAERSPSLAKRIPSPADGGRLAGRTLAVPAALLGLIGLIITIGGWEASASTTRASSAFDAAGWSAAGLILAGLGAALLIIGRKRSVRLREMAILTPVALEGARRTAARRSESTAATDGSVYYAAGLHHFHRQGCAALAGLQADACHRPAAAQRLAPCPLCEP